MLSKRKITASLFAVSLAMFWDRIVHMKISF